jgi:hypothetical protein
MVVGGKDNGSNPLSSVEIYDVSTGCYNITNMNYARMQHTAAYFNSSDIVLVMGGLGSSHTAIASSELISIASAQIYQSMSQARYQHAIADLSSSNILIVPGRGLNDTSEQLEIYNRSLSSFQQIPLSHPELNNLEGHSVTVVGETTFVFIFGGYNGTAYSETGMIYDIENSTLVEPQEEDLSIELPSARAHHQATYIPSLNAVLITGGDNGTHTFSSSYLYCYDTHTWNSTGAMQRARSFHKAVLLGNNSVLIIGGATGMENNQPNTPTDSVERYDILANTYTIVTSLNVASYSHEAVSIDSEEIFIFGGIDANENVLSRIEYIMY